MNAAPSLLDVERFRVAVEQWLGLSFNETQHGPLADTLRRRLVSNALGAGDYFELFENANRRRGELRAIAEALTVSETSFFRNPDQIRAFREIALPELLSARKADRRLRILSAGCASGEEAYTLAACVHDTPGSGGCDIAIQGIDINRAMLKRAAAARYTAWSLRQTPAPMQARLFRSEGNEFVLDAAIRTMVTFEERNLVTEDETFWQPGSFDAIFCRNVLMYFSLETMRSVVARLAASLTPGGFLFVGHAETLRGLSSAFHLRHTHNSFYYQRKEARETSQPAHIPLTSTPARQRDRIPANSNDIWAEQIRRSSERIQLLTIARGPDRERRGGLAVAVRTDLSRAIDLLGREQFSAALAILRALPPERVEDSEVMLLNAVLLTHGGNPASAEQICDKLLMRDELNPEAHYLAALCREHAGDVDGAIDHDQRAAYLDQRFAMPRLHLGRLLRRSGNKSLARQELRQALLLLERENGARLLMFGGGFGRDALIGLCRAELTACGDAA